ncbi:hypothetical protein D3C72_1829630 [compost metagenome]
MRMKSIRETESMAPRGPKTQSQTMAAIATTDVRRLRPFPVRRGVTKLSMSTLMTKPVSNTSRLVVGPCWTKAMRTGGIKLSSMPKRGM